MTLKELKIGESAVIDTVGGTGELRQHFLDMGLIPGEKVTLVKFAPMGDPMELQIHGYELTLRLDDAARIEITPAEAPAAAPARKAGRMVEHPGLGEGGRYHTKKGEHPLPEVLSEFWVFQEKVDMKVSAFSFTTSLLVFGYL